MKNVHIDWLRFRRDCTTLRQSIPAHHLAKGVYGVPTGGCFVALEMHHAGAHLWDHPHPGCVIVDDLIDSGRTMRSYDGAFFKAAIYRKPWSPADLDVLTIDNIDGWIHLPWERAPHPEDAVVRLLQWMGEDPTREGLRDTPGRVCRAWKEATAGYTIDPTQVLSKRFDASHDEMVILRDIAFSSTCEHHLLPFMGEVSIGYIPPPGGQVVGVSKLARLVECFARRLQVQERMTTQIADAIQHALSPLGVGVVAPARHLCMVCRGVRQSNALMITSAVRGCMRDKSPARDEWLRLTDQHTP